MHLFLLKKQYIKLEQLFLKMTIPKILTWSLTTSWAVSWAHAAPFRWLAAIIWIFFYVILRWYHNVKCWATKCQDQEHTYQEYEVFGFENLNETVNIYTLLWDFSLFFIHLIKK